MRSGINVPKNQKSGKGPKKFLHSACERTQKMYIQKVDITAALYEPMGSTKT
jgi:hypothetical protein